MSSSSQVESFRKKRGRPPGCRRNPFRVLLVVNQMHPGIVCSTMSDVLDDWQVPKTRTSAANQTSLVCVHQEFLARGHPHLLLLRLVAEEERLVMLLVKMALLMKSVAVPVGLASASARVA